MTNINLFKTSEYVDFLKSIGAKVTVNNNPSNFTIKRIQKIIKKHDYKNRTNNIKRILG
jgi:hypothetical protein